MESQIAMFLTLAGPVPAMEQIRFSRPRPCSASLADRFSLELFPSCPVVLVIAVDFCIHTPGSLMPPLWKAGWQGGRRGGGGRGEEGRRASVFRRRFHASYPWNVLLQAVCSSQHPLRGYQSSSAEVLSSESGGAGVKRELPIKPDVLFHPIAQKIRKTSSFPEEGAASPCTEQWGCRTVYLPNSEDIWGSIGCHLSP